MSEEQMRKLLQAVIEELHYAARHDCDQWICHSEPCETWRQVRELS